MSRKKKKEPESVLQSAKMPSVVEQLQPPGKKTSAIITVPAALVAIATILFVLVRFIKWSWFLW